MRCYLIYNFSFEALISVLAGTRELLGDKRISESPSGFTFNFATYRLSYAKCPQLIVTLKKIFYLMISLVYNVNRLCLADFFISNFYFVY